MPRPCVGWSRRLCAQARLGAVVALLVLSAGCRRDHDNAATRAAQARIEADVRRLADDVMEGREAGTRGHARAAAYVAARFRQLGLIPAGDKGGYL